MPEWVLYVWYILGPCRCRSAAAKTLQRQAHAWRVPCTLHSPARRTQKLIQTSIYYKRPQI